MMILSILATIILLGALFYHRVSLFLQQPDSARLDRCAWRRWLWSIWLLVPLAIILVTV
ncbi:acyl-CoA dehydrogenase [Salmonella bongori]|nr:acyl-CoA dehydrogenase [Salmonella bongori]